MTNDQRPMTHHVCGHELITWLKQSRTALCRAENGRRLVLKQLDSDCLLDGQLHPDIHDRLAHIRQMAHSQIATLISVERDTDGKVWTLSEYIEGTSFEKWACNPERDGRQVARMMRELVLAIESLHGLGIVHGRLSEGNAIVDAQGKVRLLDLSPLLFQEVNQDISALAAMFERVIRSRNEQDTRVGQALLGRENAQLQELSSALSRALAAQDSNGGNVTSFHDDERKLRSMAMRWVALAAGVALIAAVLGAWIFSATQVRSADAPPEAMKER